MRLLRLLTILVLPGCAIVAHAPDSVPSSLAAAEETLLRGAGIDGAGLHCNRDSRWGNQLRRDAASGAAELMSLVASSLAPLDDTARAALEKKLEKALMWRMVRAVILEGDTNNWGVLALRGRTFRDAAGAEHPVLIFRSGFTPDPDSPASCFTSLLAAGNVRHVVNLFDGDIPVADLVAAESRAAAAAGASYHTATDDAGGYGPWRDQLRKHYDDPRIRAAAMGAVARLIRDQVLLPDGKPPRGNIHIHCGGGMHRTGMIAGVIERCINHEAPAVVESHYQAHVGWRSAEQPGGYEAGNLQFIREFDCALLQ